MLSSLTLPGSSLRGKSLTAPPHPTQPSPHSGSKRPCSLARPASRPFPFLPRPNPPPSTYLPTPSSYLPIYLSTYPSTYPSTYLPTALLPAPLSLPSSRPAPGPVYQLPLPITFPRPFSSFSSPQALPDRSRAFFLFFSFFMLIRRDSNPTPLCLPIKCQFNAYANCAPPVAQKNARVKAWKEPGGKD